MILKMVTPPGIEEYIPGVQGTQAERSARPATLLYVPAGQGNCVGAPVPGGQ